MSIDLEAFIYPEFLESAVDETLDHGRTWTNGRSSPVVIRRLVLIGAKDFQRWESLDADSPTQAAVLVSVHCSQSYDALQCLGIFSVLRRFKILFV